jgi:type III secretion system FlhB-like substrate exporter
MLIKIYYPIDKTERFFVKDPNNAKSEIKIIYETIPDHLYQIIEKVWSFPIQHMQSLKTLIEQSKNAFTFEPFKGFISFNKMENGLQLYVYCSKYNPELLQFLNSFKESKRIVGYEAINYSIPIRKKKELLNLIKKLNLVNISCQYHINYKRHYFI